MYQEAFHAVYVLDSAVLSVRAIVHQEKGIMIVCISKMK